MITWDTDDLARESAADAFVRMTPTEQEADQAFLRARAQARLAEAAHRERECHVWEDGYCWSDDPEEPPTERELQEWTEPDPFEGAARIETNISPLGETNICAMAQNRPARSAWHKKKKRSGSIGRRQRCGR